jgi:hypothetical protein
MKTYGGVDVYVHVFLTSTLFGGERSASRPGRLTPRERDPRTHWIGSWMTLERSGQRQRGENFCHYRDSKADPLAVQPVASRYTYCAIPTPTIVVRHAKFGMEIDHKHTYKFCIKCCL